MNSTPAHETAPRELCHRTNDGIEVALLWTPATDHLMVCVIDTRLNQSFQIPVAASSAMRAFHHPYAHSGPTTVFDAVPAASTGDRRPVDFR